MKRCRSCDHYVIASETTCPFCGASVSTPRAPLGPLGLAVGLLTAACGPSTGSEGDESGEMSSSGTTPITTSVTTTSTSPGSSTTMGPEATGSSTTSLDSSSDDQGGSFYAGPPDGPGVLLCDLQEQDCPEDEKCAPWANDGSPFHNDTRCTPIADNPGQAGEPCGVEGAPYSGIDDCDIGLVCAEVDSGTNQGVCRPICDPEDAAFCEDPDLVCVGWYDGGLPICSPACDALMQDCGPDLGCYGDPDVVCDSAVCGYAHPGAAGQQGDECTWPNHCAPGLNCTDAALVPGCAGARCCTQFCDIADPTSCDAIPGTSCSYPYEEGMCPPAFYETGVCISS